jgi:hypothetical protein
MCLVVHRDRLRKQQTPYRACRFDIVRLWPRSQRTLPVAEADTGRLGFAFGASLPSEAIILQHAIQDEINSAPNIESILHNHPLYLNVAMHYIRPKQLVYVREALQSVICEVVSTDDLDLETDPSLVRISLADFAYSDVLVDPPGHHRERGDAIGKTKLYTQRGSILSGTGGLSWYAC